MDWDARRYHRISDPQVAWGRQVLQRLAPQAGERILDLGCGSGRLTAELLERIGAGHVVGLDRSAAMLAAAVRYRREHPPVTPLHDASTEPSRLSFVRGDGGALPFADAFDGVVSTATLHWLLDHDAAFSSVYVALAPGGRFVAQCGGFGNLRALLERAAGLMSDAAWASAFHGWTDPWLFATVPDTVLRLERAGFTAIDVTLHEAPTPFEDRATYEEFIACVCLRHHLARLPGHRQAAFVGALGDQAAADPVPFSLDYRRLNISARKPAATEQAA
jgi:trans-aconitate 2-methyltransferase